ncbi:MAG TPA: protein-disulfide reductase DsbD domain-containing protein [Tepidisphaeraceae bacterium]|nr:protein-disulfide reductase DsbD domain-containing protein [Tepidisphaeraceae bacterium]
MSIRLPLLVLALLPSLALAAGPMDAALVRPTLVADVSAITPGASFTLGVRLQIKPKWHVYWANPGETGQATVLKPAGPDGFTFGPVQWPVPVRLDHDFGLTYAYEDDVLLMIPVTAPKTLNPGDPVTLKVDADWQSCHDDCIDGRAKLSITLPVAPDAKPANEKLFATWRARLPVAQDPAVIRQVEQKSSAGKPEPSVMVTWNAAPPAKVDWYPVSTRAVMIEGVKLTTNGGTTQIAFKSTVYKPDQLPAGGAVDGLLVYENAKGERVGTPLPVKVAK